MVISRMTTLPDEGRPQQYVTVLTEAYRVGFNSGLTSLFPGVDKVCLSLTVRSPLQTCLTSMSGTNQKKDVPDIAIKRLWKDKIANRGTTSKI